ncbi:DUF1573 domain-containing protein [Lewinella sp. LCG006]|uniref:DUF1573 domain-containing protein n=1 Tax=Lewinella sp. LCG006 TaxID=3231911 RepID=UPI00346020E7
MKFLLLSMAFSGLLFSFPAPNAPVVWQVPTTYDFGDLERGVPRTTIFTFRNIGSDALYIDNVRTSCGCTSPEWEDVRVAPDSLGHIVIEYDADDTGYFNKGIKVYFNGYRKAERLSIEGWVEE